MTAIKKTIMLTLAALLLVPAAASAQSAANQSPLEAAYFAQINSIVSRHMEEVLPKEKWPAGITRLMVLVQIKEDGTIGFSELAQKSEHEFMNQALTEALKKSQPLPMPPEELQSESEMRLMGLVFNFDKNSPSQPEDSPSPGEADSPPTQAPEAASKK